MWEDGEGESTVVAAGHEEHQVCGYGEGCEGFDAVLMDSGACEYRQRGRGILTGRLMA